MSQRLGIAVTTLRTWHQRYGLGPSVHQAGSHRRYGEADLRRLETMRQLTTQGVPAAEAARIAKAGSHAKPTAVRAGGGHAIPVGRAGSKARGLARAAIRLDADAVRTTVSEAIMAHGVVAAWDDLVVPVLVGVGRKQAATGKLIEVEHLLSRGVSAALATVPRPVSDSLPRVLLACADEEQHSLPLEALAAALAERGLGCRMLGARTPVRALIDAIRRTGPAAVVLWSQTAETGDIAQLRVVLATGGRPALVIAAGPGWPERLPEGVSRPVSLPEAVDLVTLANGA